MSNSTQRTSVTGEVDASKHDAGRISVKREERRVQTIQHGDEMVKKMQKANFALACNEEQRVHPLESLGQIEDDHEARRGMRVKSVIAKRGKRTGSNQRPEQVAPDKKGTISYKITMNNRETNTNEQRDEENRKKKKKHKKF